LMTARFVLASACVCWLAAPSIVRAEDPQPLELGIALVERSGDRAYQGATAYAGLFRRQRFSPVPAAQLAVEDGAAEARARGFKLTVLRKTLATTEDAAASVDALARGENVLAAILDLPIEDVVQVAGALADAPPLLFNARHRDDGLRLETCATRLLHTLPSWSMLYDGLAEVLVALDWRRILVLRGAQPQDAALSSVFVAAATKFGLRVADVRDFSVGNDPRRRDQINVRLLTAGADYDVVFVADADGEFARTVPFNTAKPRPVVGTAGLVPSAWHPYWERYGAPQLNRRFFRAAGRIMTDEDWATWIAVRATQDAAMRAPELSVASVLAVLLGEELRLDLYKGAPGSFRPWSRQLRQPILLGSHDAVLAVAPVEGVLHQRNALDTLGPDEPEFRCRR
jgi:ABC transporter substrate binding protein (PQQ-dependent alcohol dehydrogenase system)